MSFTSNQLERRHNRDLRTHLINWLGSGLWILMLVWMIILGNAKPQEANFFDRFFEVNVYSSWNRDLLTILDVLMVLGFLGSVAGLVMNTTRHKRKSDHYRAAFFLIGLASLMGVITMVLR